MLIRQIFAIFCAFVRAFSISKQNRKRMRDNANLVPRVLSYPPYGARERERERPWKTLVTWLRNKIKFWGRSPCLTLFLSGLFATFTTFTQWSQQQDRFSNPTTTITETAWPNSTRIHFLSAKSSKKILLKIVFTVTQKKYIYIYIGNRPVKEAKNMKCY